MKNFNPFGMAFTKALGATGVNDPIKIAAGFDKAVKEKNPATGETFGDRIAKDALPAGTTPVGGGGGGSFSRFATRVNGISAVLPLGRWRWCGLRQWARGRL